jgi:hypothetical protein
MLARHAASLLVPRAERTSNVHESGNSRKISCLVWTSRKRASKRTSSSSFVRICCGVKTSIFADFAISITFPAGGSVRLCVGALTLADVYIAESSLLTYAQGAPGLLAGIGTLLEEVRRETVPQRMRCSLSR